MAHQPHHPEWTFLSNHSHVLHCVFLWPDIRIRDIAVKVLITERAVQRIVVDLERGGYLQRERVGRQNYYRLQPRLHLRHPLENHVEVGQVLAALQPGAATRVQSLPNLLPPATLALRERNGASLGANGDTDSRLKTTTRKPRKLHSRKSV